jgi:hypothetical protein
MSEQCKYAWLACCKSQASSSQFVPFWHMASQFLHCCAAIIGTRDWLLAGFICSRCCRRLKRKCISRMYDYFISSPYLILARSSMSLFKAYFSQIGFLFLSFEYLLNFIRSPNYERFSARYSLLFIFWKPLNMFVAPWDLRCTTC